ncbi:hypothetical protein AA12717_0862 [Gluconacetobacter sacchari DSM 12717]|uniref:Uncharacterized protein n=1 Tax=Gluconacetobacter sacchari DSM 12717 TaxID=1307940 RepID=A0ABQ0P437_9PROT|nr:hypothetical protein AA12717_0862 [Gluconacetobacter sacchari DSM 12717]
MVPQGRAGIQRFVTEDVQHRAAQMAGIEGGGLPEMAETHDSDGGFGGDPGNQVPSEDMAFLRTCCPRIS